MLFRSAGMASSARFSISSSGPVRAVVRCGTMIFAGAIEAFDYSGVGGNKRNALCPASPNLSGSRIGQIRGRQIG